MHQESGDPQGHAKRMLEGFAIKVENGLATKRYPSGLGSELCAFVSEQGQQGALLLKKRVGMEQLHMLCSVVEESDLEDFALLLFHAIIDPKVLIDGVPGVSDLSESAEKAVEVILSKTNSNYIEKDLIAPIDAAIACHGTQGATVSNMDEFIDAVAGFTKVLQEASAPLRDGSEGDFKTIALDRLSRVFASKGGLVTAYGLARTGVDGGLRQSFAALRKSYVQEITDWHIASVLRKTIDPLDTALQLAVIEVLKKRLLPLLPPGAQATPAKSLLEDLSPLVMTLKGAGDMMQKVVRSVP